MVKPKFSVHCPKYNETAKVSYHTVDCDSQCRQTSATAAARVYRQYQSWQK